MTEPGGLPIARTAPNILPQPVLAPLTPVAIFLVVTIDSGGEQQVHDALPDLTDTIFAAVRRYGRQTDDETLVLVRATGV